MNELNNNRAALISGNLPLDEMRKVKLEATGKIDTGNKLLGLDMVVRDENGDILDTNTICTTELFENHVNALTRIEKANVGLNCCAYFCKLISFNAYISDFCIIAPVSRSRSVAKSKQILAQHTVACKCVCVQVPG